MKIIERELTPVEQKLIDLVRQLAEEKKVAAIDAAIGELDGDAQQSNLLWDAIFAYLDYTQRATMILGEMRGVRAGVALAAEAVERSANDASAWPKLLAELADDERTATLVQRTMNRNDTLAAKLLQLGE